VSEGIDTEGCLEFLEAAYCWELPEEKWLARLATATSRVWGRPRWACGFTYDLSDLKHLRFARPVLLGGSPLVEEFLVDGMSQLTPDMLARSFRATSLGFARPLGLINDMSADRMRRLDMVDYFGINGRDAGGKGCFIGLGAERAQLSAGEILIFQRLAFHLASAYRVRCRLREHAQDPLDQWEALFHPDGHLLEARGPAEPPEEKKALGRAAQSMLDVRRRRGGIVEPTSGWRPRIQGRWTLVDAFSRSGRRYIVARENEAPGPGLDGLTGREQQVVASAISGRSNKEIAYDLGITPATTRVLLARACAKLGVRTKQELLQLPILKALRGEPPDSK
jgi:DNA-binding CsgD family transcriptional regulator